MYFGRRYTSTIKGSVWVPVQCDHCSFTFAYKVNVKAQGQGNSPYLLNNSGAQEAAQQRAKEAFERKAKKAYAIVPCPNCGTIHSSMVKREQQHNSDYAIGLAFAAGALLLGILGGKNGSALTFGVLFIVFSIWLITKHTIASVMAATIALMGGWLLIFNGFSSELSQYSVLWVLLPLIPAMYYLYVAYFVDLNADLGKNMEKPRKHQVTAIKRSVKPAASNVVDAPN